MSQPSEKTDTATTDEAGSYSVESMNHLGLVAAMVDELRLVECIDPMMPQDFNQRTVSIGLADCRLTGPPRQASPATPPEEGNFGRGARRAVWSVVVTGLLGLKLQMRLLSSAHPIAL